MHFAQLGYSLSLFLPLSFPLLLMYRVLLILLEEGGGGGEVVVLVNGDKVTLLCGFFLEGLVVGVVQLMVELHGLVSFRERMPLA
jgi:hypothetical protein